MYFYFNTVIYSKRKMYCMPYFVKKKKKKPSNITSNVIVPLLMVFIEMPEKDEGTQAIWKSTFDNDYKELEEIGRLVTKLGQNL